MQVGDPFDPKNTFVGIFIPLGLNRRRNVSGNAKRIYGQLVWHLNAGVACCSQSELAEECAISLRCCRACLDELEQQGFIKMVGRRNRRLLWQFLWHACFDGCTRNRQNMPVSENGNRQKLPVTPETEEKQPEGESKPAKIADDNRQKLPITGDETGKNCRSHVHEPIYIDKPKFRNPDLEEGEEKSLSHELSGEFSTSEDAGDVDERPISILDILCASPDGGCNKARAPDSVIEDCDRLAAHYGQGLVMHYLEIIQKTNIRGSNRVIPYLENCLENHKERAKQTNGGRSGPPSKKYGA